jgi:hypothetical protein
VTGEATVTITVRAGTRWQALVALRARRARVASDLERAQRACAVPSPRPKDRHWMALCERDLASLDAAIEDLAQGLDA